MHEALAGRLHVETIHELHRFLADDFDREHLREQRAFVIAGGIHFHPADGREAAATLADKCLDEFEPPRLLEDFAFEVAENEDIEVVQLGGRGRETVAGRAQHGLVVGAIRRALVKPLVAGQPHEAVKFHRRVRKERLPRVAIFPARFALDEQHANFSGRTSR